ncbi:hypothetical protein KFK09_021091 [Dendrobium nobile]|uniref:Uncharacterized protein n=1 Tax=Dendrobium nobile TaxID=94219 RepID=A0A8T3ANG3_DENNO|nr:hypothetical protein KFK09_021091 [Dendrobium nobile]
MEPKKRLEREEVISQPASSVLTSDPNVLTSDLTGKESCRFTPASSLVASDQTVMASEPMGRESRRTEQSLAATMEPKERRNGDSYFTASVLPFLPPIKIS